MPKAWTHGPTKENWEQQKSAIHRLYIVNDLTLQGVLSELTKLGLNATKPQLEYKLKKWGFRKNLSQDEWRSINRETAKRKFEDKETDLIYSGKRLKSGTIEKARLRYGNSKHVVSDNSALVLPQELTICTPPPMSIEFSGWPETLPWLTFVSNQDAFLKNVSSQMHARFLSSSRSSTAETEPSQSLARRLPTGLIPEHLRSAPLQLAAVFAKYMPEMHSDEHVQRAQAILKGRGETYVLEHLKLMIYHVSNKLSDFFMFNDRDDSWEAVVSMLRGGGILDIELDIKTTQDETLLAFCETLFRQAICRADSACEISYESAMEVLRWLLKSGIDLDQRTCFGKVPLQYCLDHGGGDLNLLRLLLESGANPSLVKLENWRFESNHYYMRARLLFERGAVADSLNGLLHLTLRNRDLDFASTLISRHHADPASILKLHYPRSKIMYEESALCIAAETGMEEVNFVLRHLHLRYPSVPQPTFITPDAYIAAAYSGSEDVTRLFLELDPSALRANILGITAFHVAAEEGHYGVCQLLLPRLSGEAFLQQYPTPLHLAIRKNHREVVQLFIENGVDVNSKGTGIISNYMEHQEKPRTPLQEAMRSSHSFSCISDLLSAGADYSGVDISEAAESGNEQLIFLVLTAGAHPDLKDNGSAIALQRILRADHERVLVHPKFKALAWSFLDTKAQLLGGEIVGAIRWGWWDIVASLTASRSLIDTDIYGRTTIEAAIMSASCPPDFMEHAFEAYRYSYEPGSLCAAVWKENLPSVRRLLASRPENKSPDVLESTALGLAAALGLSEIVKELLAVLPKASALIPLNPNLGVIRIEDKKMARYKDGLIFWHWNLGPELANGSPLALAALASSPELFNSLLEHGYQSDLLTWLACAGNNTTEMLELLLDRGQRISRGDIVFHNEISASNALRVAISSPMAQQSVKLLLGAGEGVNSSWMKRGINNTSVLYQAIVEGKNDVVSELLKAGADTNKLSTDEDGRRCTPLHLAIETGNTYLVSELLEAGADVNLNLYGLRGVSALELAAEHGDADMLGNLLKAGADVNAGPRRKDHGTALQLAVRRGDMDIISTLLKAGADVNASPGGTYGATALQFAAMNGHIGLAKQLLELGALVNAPRASSWGRTALEGAAEHGRLDMVRLLLEKGALIHNEGRRQYVRAVEFAITRGHLVIAELLKAHGDWGDSDQQMLEPDYDGGGLKLEEPLWGDDIGQMPQTDEDSEMSDLTEETDLSEYSISESERDSAEFWLQEDRLPNAPTTVVGVVEDDNAPGDNDVAFAIHSWANGELPQSTTT